MRGSSEDGTGRMGVLHLCEQKPAEQKHDNGNEQGERQGYSASLANSLLRAAFG